MIQQKTATGKANENIGEHLSLFWMFCDKLWILSLRMQTRGRPLSVATQLLKWPQNHLKPSLWAAKELAILHRWPKMAILLEEIAFWGKIEIYIYSQEVNMRNITSLVGAALCCGILIVSKGFFTMSCPSYGLTNNLGKHYHILSLYKIKKSKSQQRDLSKSGN